MKQRLVHVRGSIRSVGLEYVTVPVIKSSEHLVGSLRARWGESVLNPQILAQHIKLLVPLGSCSRESSSRSVNSFPLYESRLVILIGQALGKASRNLQVLASLLYFMAYKNTEHVGCVDRHKQINTRGLGSAVRQVIDVLTGKIRQVALKGPVNQRRGFRIERGQFRDATAEKSLARTRTREPLIEKSASERQKIIRGKKQFAARVSVSLNFKKLQAVFCIKTELRRDGF